jgi:hypothetical protein
VKWLRDEWWPAKRTSQPGFGPMKLYQIRYKRLPPERRAVVIEARRANPN